MSVKRIGKHRVDVAHDGCGPHLACYQLGFDKGPYVPGRGYTSYYKTPRAVCWTRHLHGCPVAWVCPPPCSTAHAPGAPSTCRCGSTVPKGAPR